MAKLIFSLVMTIGGATAAIVGLFLLAPAAALVGGGVLVLLVGAVMIDVDPPKPPDELS